MDCWPECSPWCDCVNGTCQPSPVTINAVRLRTPDGRYLQAAGGGGGLMLATSVAAPATSETFLFVSPAAWPLSSGSPISLDVCNANWDRAGFLVRVDHGTIVFPASDKKGTDLVSYEIGGPGQRVFVSGPLPIGVPAYRGNDPAEWTFDIVKLVGGGAASPGVPINNGDQVSLRINSNYGKIFFFRVTGSQSGAEVHGDGTAPGQSGAVFTVEFSEVRSALGWRPSAIKCQSCAVVTARVTRSSTSNPIGNATVVALVPSHPFIGTTGSDGRATLLDAEGRNCIPQGNVQLQASANRHQTKTVNAAVPDAGSIEVPIQLDCTQVSGKVIDTAGSAVPGVTVVLRDQAGNVILDENGNPYLTTTKADGSFVFNCVAHDFVQVYTTAAPNQMQHTRVVPPEGWTNVTIVVQTTCGNLVGRVIDATTGTPIQGATVTAPGGRQETTDPNGCFTFVCLRTAGTSSAQLIVEAPGYTTKIETVIVPATGSFTCQNPPPNPVIIKLQRITVMAYQIRLDWGAQPADLDAHLSGPNPAGGRFHIYYGSLAPVSFADLDLDDTTALGPETITIRRSPATAAGVFVAGDYRCWVHNYTGKFDPTSSFVGSGAAVSVTAVDAQGNLSQIGRYEVVNATGTSDDLWHVVNLAIDANGNVVPTVVQTFQPGDESTVL